MWGRAAAAMQCYHLWARNSNKRPQNAVWLTETFVKKLMWQRFALCLAVCDKMLLKCNDNWNSFDYLWQTSSQTSWIHHVIKTIAFRVTRAHLIRVERLPGFLSSSWTKINTVVKFHVKFSFSTTKRNLSKTIKGSQWRLARAQSLSVRLSFYFFHIAFR